MIHQRSAIHLYRLHLALAALGLALVLAAGASAVVGVDPGVPSLASITDACEGWLSAGGPGAVVGLLVALLALATLVSGLRSARRQIVASRRYLGALPIEDRTTMIDGATCRLIDAAGPQAFCAGYLRPRIYLSRGAVERLDRKQLRAIITHELHHLRRRDPLRLLLARTLADALFFIPLLRRISERYAALGELAADEAAVSRLESRGPLASALLEFSDGGAEGAPVVAVAPERVDHLLGDPEAGRWRLPRSLAGRSALVLVGLGALMASAWHGIFAPTLELPLLLAAGCMMVMIGGPVALAASAVVISRRALRARQA